MPAALRLNEDDDCLRTAFSSLGLSPNEIADWKTLATVLAERVFAEPRLGAPVKWSIERLGELLADAQIVQNNSDWVMSDSGVCQVLKKKREYSKRWGKVHVEVLRKRLSEARRRIIGDGETPRPRPIGWLW